MGMQSDDHPLRRWRLDHRVTQRSLGEKLGVDELTVWRWETGATEPRKASWDKIKEITGLTRAEFLGFAEAAQ
jgi:transcriptional regulator with XRE-family HTH domain